MYHADIMGMSKIHFYPYHIEQVKWLPVSTDNISTLKIHLCPPHIGKVKWLSGSVRLDALQNAFLWINLTVPEEALDKW